MMADSHHLANIRNFQRIIDNLYAQINDVNRKLEDSQRETDLMKRKSAGFDDRLERRDQEIRELVTARDGLRQQVCS